MAHFIQQKKKYILIMKIKLSVHDGNETIHQPIYFENIFFFSSFFF